MGLWQVLEALQLYRPKVYEFARLNITYTVRQPCVPWGRKARGQWRRERPVDVLTGRLLPGVGGWVDGAGAVEAQAAEAGQVQPREGLGRPTHAHHQGSVSQSKETRPSSGRGFWGACSIVSDGTHHPLADGGGGGGVGQACVVVGTPPRS